jgi:hypothetical protein
MEDAKAGGDQKECSYLILITRRFIMAGLLNTRREKSGMVTSSVPVISDGTPNLRFVI